MATGIHAARLSAPRTGAWTIHHSAKAITVTAWATAAIAASFVEAIARLGLRALQTAQAGLTSFEWLALATAVVVFSYYEGHRALSRRFVPKVVARAMACGLECTSIWSALLAPLRALALIGHSRRELARAWLAVALIVLAVFLVRLLPSPWRGIVDAGVAAALMLGLCSLVTQTVVAMRAARS